MHVTNVVYVGNNFLNNISVEDYGTFIQLLKTAILSTDLSLYLAGRTQYFVRRLGFQ